MSIFNINPMPDDEETQTIPPTATSDNDFQDIISNDQPATTVEPTTPTPAATPAPKQKPALSEFEQYKSMYPDDAIQKYVESFRPNPSDDRSARFAKYTKINAIGQGLTAIANLVGASHGAKIYAPQQNNTTQQLIGASEQEKAKQEEKQKQYNLMKYQSALNTLNAYRTYKAALAKQDFDAGEKQKDRDNAKTIADNNNATSKSNTEANNATSKYVSDNNNKSAERRNAASNATTLKTTNINNAAKLNQIQTEYGLKEDHPMVLNGKKVIVPAAIFNTTLSNLASNLSADQIAAGGSAYPAILKNKVYNQIAKDYTVDKNGTLVSKQTGKPITTAVHNSVKTPTYMIMGGKEKGKVRTIGELKGLGYTDEKIKEYTESGVLNLQ